MVRRLDRALRLMEEPDVGRALGGRGLVKQKALDRVKDAMRVPLELAMLHKENLWFQLLSMRDEMLAIVHYDPLVQHGEF